MKSSVIRILQVQLDSDPHRNPIAALQDEGLRVEAWTAHSASEALAVAGAEPFDAILIGRDLPNVESELFEALRVRGSSVPTFVLADVSPAREAALLRFGVRVVAPARLGTLGPLLRFELDRANLPPRAEKHTALDDLAQPLRELIAHLDGVIYEVDGDTYDFTYVSPSAVGLLGYPVSAWYSPQFWISRVHPDDATRADEFWLQEAAARRAHVFEYRMIAADRRVVWIQDRVTPIVGPDGQASFLGMMLDVTKLKQAEQTVGLVGQLTAHHVGDEFLRSLVAGLTETLDVRYATVTEMSETDPNTIQTVALGRGGTIIEPVTYELCRSPCGMVIRGETNHVATGLATIYPDCLLVGTLAADSYLGYPLLDAEQRPIGVLAILDVKPIERSGPVDTAMSLFAARAGAELQRRRSERQKQSLQLQLVQAQKMEAIGTLAGGIAHDFNNILMGILGNAEIAQEELATAHPASVNLREVVKAAHRARDLVQRILTFSQKRDPERHPVTLRSIIEEATGFLRATLSPNIAIRVDRAAESLPILGDPSQIHQALINLATNAAQAMGLARGTLTFTERVVDVDRPMAETYAELREGRYVRVSVQDTGPGMTREVLGRIFEPFFTTRPPGEGTGLGLAVVHGIMRDHGGAIVVRSQINEGTSFDLYFPTIVGSAETPSELSYRAGAGRRILFIDDDPAVVRVGRRILERLGYRVTASESAREALRAFNRAPEDFGLVIADLALPELNGFQIAGLVRAGNPTIRIVLTTSSVDLVELGSRAHEVDDVLAKPFATARLAHVVSRLIGPPNERDGVLYFAYGANLDHEHMGRTAPGAAAAGRAVLPDHRIVIGQAGFATIVPAPGQEVHGLLWHLTPEDERALDQFEGVAQDLYQKSTTTVRTAGGEQVKAMIYLASDPSPGHAARAYVEQILRAAIELDFPADYRAMLDQLPSSGDRQWSGRPIDDQAIHQGDLP